MRFCKHLPKLLHLPSPTLGGSGSIQDITGWYSVALGQYQGRYWLVLGDTASVWSSTGWCLMVLVQHGTRWYWASVGPQIQYRVVMTNSQILQKFRCNGGPISKQLQSVKKGVMNLFIKCISMTYNVTSYIEFA